MLELDGVIILPIGPAEVITASAAMIERVNFIVVVM
jgi:hypothetical protein